MEIKAEMRYGRFLSLALYTFRKTNGQDTVSDIDKEPAQKRLKTCYQNNKEGGLPSSQVHLPEVTVDRK
jgi:hypothetical protein